MELRLLILNGARTIGTSFISRPEIVEALAGDSIYRSKIFYNG
jgi:hypothetical protein